MKKHCLKLILLLFTTAFKLPAFAQGGSYPNIKNYQVYYGWAKKLTEDWVIIRRFEQQGKPYLLLVNPQSLETKVNDADFYTVKPMTMDEARVFFKNTSYLRAMAKAEKQAGNIQDAGIEHGMPKQAGINLTADLCPSHRPLDKIIFTDIFNEFGKVERPVPVALSITGLWMEKHQADLQWLKKMQDNQEINITWINHSFNHRVSKTAPLKDNFLLEPGTNIDYEVLATEQLMLKNGLLPSVFFRFPGLVSDEKLVDRILDFGLIPIGTDAWLAKGQQPQAGSIVLIHGNGNEPVGVHDFINLLKSEAGSVTKKQWMLYDLRESVGEEFESGQ